MKKVRFESPVRVFSNTMGDLECHSPRPFIDKQVVVSRPVLFEGYQRLLPYSSDPVHRFENSNNSPYPTMNKTLIDDSSSRCMPSNDLDLSMLDGSTHVPRKPPYHTKQVFSCEGEQIHRSDIKTFTNAAIKSPQTVLSSIENTSALEQSANNIRSNNFFIRRDNLKELNSHNVYFLQNQMGKLSLNKENVALEKQAEIARLSAANANNTYMQQQNVKTDIPNECRCHHCIKLIENASCKLNQHNQTVTNNSKEHIQTLNCSCNLYGHRLQSLHNSYHYNNCVPVEHQSHFCHCQKEDAHPEIVDKKTWMLKKYEQSKDCDRLEIDRQNIIVKEKREPTVADLFKIIKLQNEQLQLLQEKVDKFISATSVNRPVQNYVTEQGALETVGSEQQKISIGVMTSFEMVRTSTVINKEIVTQTNESGHIQCNRSQISIKEVVSKSQQGNLNFLDGITPITKADSLQNLDCTKSQVQKGSDKGQLCLNENVNDDKTLNELSLYNVEIDNAITPQISPEQSLYLDVRDYSDSDSGGEDNSNVGWTYYNKVMTHVNGMLQDSDMPSSASAMYRNMRQQCVQMQIDKTNVSVTKRVKFGDDPLGIQQPHIYNATTDTSLKMNQLAAKYLKINTPPLYQIPSSKPTVMPIDMSFATRNYMERHKILQGGNMFPSQPGPAIEMPKFLDITALKQQPKFL